MAHLHQQRDPHLILVLVSSSRPVMVLGVGHPRTKEQEEVVFGDSHHILRMVSLVEGCHSALPVHMQRWPVVVASNPMVLLMAFLV
jgi:hypothetical protein